MALLKMSIFKPFVAMLFALALLTLSVTASAGYAQLKAPPGWSTGMGAAVPGQVGVFKFGAAANDVGFKGSTVLTNASLNVAGQLVTVPVSMRIAANAAMTAAEYSFGNPYLFAAALAAPVAYQWFKDNGFFVKDGVWGKSDSKPSDLGMDWRVVGTVNYFSNRVDACQAFLETAGCGATAKAVVAEMQCTIMSANQNGTFACTGGGFEYKNSPPHDPVFKPVGLPEFKDVMSPKKLPDIVPQELPEVEWPLQQPVINPDPSIIPQSLPAPDAVPRPFWVPTGDPVKNPNPDPGVKPDTWTQPGKDVKPAGTPTDPWRVDVTDVPKTKNDPSPNTDTPPSTTTPPAPSDFQTCGLPGKPKCGIDEFDTPKPDPAIDGKKAADDALQKLKEFAPDPVKALPALPSLNWAFRLPTGCVPFSIPAFAPFLQTIDICQFQPMFHDIMGMVWTIGGLFGAIGLFWRNTLSQN